MIFNYQTIFHSNLLGDLPDRQKEVITRRFGLRGEKETLEAIGLDLGITRERVRQIEEDALPQLRRRSETVCRSCFQYFASVLKKNGSLKREDLLLEQLGGNKFKNHVFFLLTLGKSFERIAESESFYALWTIDKNSLLKAKKFVGKFVSELKKKKQPQAIPAYLCPSYLEVSKNVLKGPQGLYGLREWPEINPRRVKDKAYLVFKKEKKPLHFTQVANLVSASCSQTVHNELIKDSRFVLVGRGLYALREWGYRPGIVREVISEVLRKAPKPLSKEEVVKKVLQQRQVQPNTILLNLQNKKYFVKKSQGYTIRKV
ncbi:MAG: hypothetical protein DRZ76_00550 [Candidatus Nealsonbacteria bacterium]|nr:MAG: hypothetical protein DRZ76_00550 [Candidatus Nealsonbacteria bacterium]